MRRRAAACVSFAAVLAACASSEKRPAETAPGASPQQNYAPPAGGAAAPPGAYGQPGYAASPHQIEIGRARDDIDSAQRELDVAAGDCRNACRALGSMDRATAHLCEIVQGPDEGFRCDDAKKKLYSARDRVRSTCGTCPDGPSVERTAPIPSR